MVSAFYTWLSTTDIEQKIDSIAQETFPLIQHFGNLANDVTEFAYSIEKLSRIQTLQELEESVSSLRNTGKSIQKEISSLYFLNFEKKFVSDLQEKVVKLIKTMEYQHTITKEALEKNAQLSNTIITLTNDQTYFLAVARPRISQGYRDFLDKGKEISQDLRHFVAELEEGGKTAKSDFKQIDQMLRIGFETLINASAGEMRANMEIVAFTFLISGILHEAAIVSTIKELEELETRYFETTPKINRIKLILSNSTPENNLILIRANPILSAGRGNESIFSLRREVLQRRQQSRENGLFSLSLAEELGADIRYLGDTSRQYTNSTIETLRKRLLQYNIFLLFSAVITVLVGFIIGFFYVNHRVSRRLSHLQKAMEQQAEGISSPIPSDRYNDEITAMSSALQKFVHQREITDKQLRRLVISLNEAQRLAKIGNCERNHKTLKWRWSTGFYHIIGYSRNDLSSNETNFWKVVHPEDKLKVELFFNTLSSQSTTSEIEFRLIRKDSAIVTVIALWKLTDDNSSFTQHGTIQNISERKLMEEEILKGRKMESISILAGGIAHDFNNLLTGIMGNIALATRLSTDDSAIIDHLKLSEDAALRARELTNKLLVFSSGGNPTKSITYLPQLIKETAEFALSGSNVKCSYEIEESVWPVDMDSGHFSQIIQNLIVNADQSMSDGGVVAISCSNILVDETKRHNLSAGHYVKITISDTGEGIEKQHLEKIFDPYYTTKGFFTEKGSGLGLAIVHSIISKHGGTIAVDSKVGKGSVFTIYIPALPQSSKAEPILTTREPKDHSGYILVMDDEKVIRDVATEMLINLGYSVKTARDGNELLQLYETLVKQGNVIEATILDLTIPGGMGGKETVSKILSKDPTAKVIVSSGYSADPVIENYTLYGFCDILPKPYSMDEMAEVVDRVVYDMK